MKNKVLSILKITFVLLAVLSISTACTKEKWYENPDKINAFTTQFEVKSTDWKFDEKDQSYYYEFDFPELTAKISKIGAVSASTIIANTNRPLAYTYYFINKEGKQCSETVSFEYNTNFIRFNVAALDLFTSSPVSFQPDNHLFKVVLVW